MGAKRRRERQAGQVDDPVRRRDEKRQVVQAVVVDAPDQRAGDLADRREGDDAERLCPALEREAGEGDQSTSHVSTPSASCSG